jgi:hypothetical protein
VVSVVAKWLRGRSRSPERFVYRESIRKMKREAAKDVSVSKVSEERGLLATLWDIITGKGKS